MKADINNLPKGYFGQSEFEVMASLLDRVSTTVTGIPGYGKTVFGKHIFRLLKKKYPEFEYFTIDTNFLPEFETLEFSKTLNQRFNNSFTDIQSYVEKLSAKNRIFILLEGISDAINPKVLTYFQKLGTINHSNITFLSVSHASILDEEFQNKCSASALFGKICIVSGISYESMLLQLSQYNWQVPGRFIDSVMELTGGNPALILYLSLYLSEYPDAEISNIRHIVKYPSLQARLNDMRELLVSYPYVIAERVRMVSEKGSFCRLFDAYLALNDKKYNVYIDKVLTPTEQKIFSILMTNRGKLIERQRLALLMGNTSTNYSMWGLYKAVERLNEKIKDTYTLLNIKGKGVVLE